MKIARFMLGLEETWGVILEDSIHAISGTPYDIKNVGDRICSLSDITLLAPLSLTNKVPAIAANYGEKDERDGPGIFMKQPGTYTSHQGDIVYPRSCKSVIHEAEVGVVISKTARHISESEAMDYVMGYTCVNDVSAKETIESDLGKGLSMRWKHFDTFCPIGPHIETEIDDPGNLKIECFVNGELSAGGNTSEMIFAIPKLISWVSEVMTLQPGDIIPTGCPETAEINIGDVVEVRIEGIGSLVNNVIEDY